MICWYVGDRMKKITVNGKTVTIDAEGDKPLLWVLREDLGLTGTKFGCGIAACGSCTVHIDGVAERSCVYPLDALSGDEKITTIEGLSENADHPVQQAWAELDVPQCGYCQSGMIMAVAAALDETPDADKDEIAEQITNICRCGTLTRVKQGIALAKKKA